MSHSMNGAQGKPANARGDLLLVAAITMASYFLASAFELQEMLTHRLALYERWQADEIPTALIVLAVGLVWYAFRRRRESQVQLTLRERAEARIAGLLARNRELAQQLISLQESERLALARELHDEFGQSCSALRAETAYLRNCAAEDHNAMTASAARADAAAQSLYLLVRDLLRRLRPAELDTLGLSSALQGLCEAWEERTGIACRFTRIEAPADISPAMGDAVDITIYRITQEALTNIARHAGAGQVDVTLSFASPLEITLDIEDDGCGMDTAAPRRGLGLLGAVERAAVVGGELQLRSAPGSGLRLELRIPVPKISAAPASPVASDHAEIVDREFAEAR
jgi:signal transduction histidine kinase